MRPTLGRLIVVLALLAEPAFAVDFEIKPAAGAPLPGVPSGEHVIRTQKSLVPFPSLSPLPGLVSQPPQAQPSVPGGKGALPALSEAVNAIAAEQAASPAASAKPAGSVPSDEAFDGKGAAAWSGADFEWPATGAPPPQEPPPGDAGGDDEGHGPQGDHPSLSFPLPAKSALLAIDPAKAIFGAVKVIRDLPKKPGERKNPSEKYWEAYQRGMELDVTVKDENIFGRPNKITYAATKTIGELSRDDFKGLVPAFQLQQPLKELRQSLIERLDADRAYFRPRDPKIALETRVRVIKFKSYLQLFKETHGKDAVPKPEPIAPRAPLVLKPEGPLETLSRFLPRAIYLDVDMIKEPLSREVLNDVAELQRTGVYVVAFSRRPAAAPGGLYDTLIKNMGPAQMTAQMPNKFLAVTDDGAVISEFGKSGNIVPVNVAAFSEGEMDVILNAAQGARLRAGLAFEDAAEIRQPPLFVEGQRFNPFQKGTAQKEKPQPRDPRVRYEVLFPKTVEGKKAGAWIASFKRRLKEQGLKVEASLTTREDGARSFVIQKTNLTASMPRLQQELGDKFGLYLNPNDIVVFSEDKKLKNVNKLMAFDEAAGLKGGRLVEDVVGRMLGKAREGGKKGSASRMIQFSGYRERYMSQFLRAQDAAEQHINFFSGHMVHSANDWLVHQVQNGRRPTPAEYEVHLRARWNRGIREIKPVGIPKGKRMERLLNASVARGLMMYQHILAAQDRGEILIGTEIPNFVVFEDYKKGEDGKLKGRYIVHTIFDFIALRPDPANPGHAHLVIYDFKTGPAKSRQKLEKDDQVRTYSLFAYERWVGKTFPVPYLSGDKNYVVDDAAVEFIYNLVQKPDIDSYMRENQRKRVIRIFNAIERTEAQLLGVTPGGKPSRAGKKPEKSRKKKS